MNGYISDILSFELKDLLHHDLCFSAEYPHSDNLMLDMDQGPAQRDGLSYIFPVSLSSSWTISSV